MLTREEKRVVAEIVQDGQNKRFVSYLVAGIPTLLVAVLGTWWGNIYVVLAAYIYLFLVGLVRIEKTKPLVSALRKYEEKVRALGERF